MLIGKQDRFIGSSVIPVGAPVLDDTITDHGRVLRTDYAQSPDGQWIALASKMARCRRWNIA